ncbi:MAG: phosphoribosyl-AMP cyclohydrolase [Candidatus Lambdaproteobacteria bacterium RIFOXYD2_FULL_50_16]|uniref:phosphoribosyl-AMP cyclohydrolase n=1 Tax=Candidatus Lambdaproteobacteria bacterium RIFOXYD2_FULL_50_16 TaxID=1817772 RepID=A0A1F6G566_9PROT|nr:MAG: phosphoribosyl-AMP cyclohydrolase [Candidatus Lambdaproteobacteria bacterium RIFOXYD2_FULL_50_16]
MAKELEEGRKLELDFGKLKKVARCGEEVLPVVAQEVGTGEVLILGYANRQALDYTLKNRVACFWSTSRNELWIKGATSGEFLDLVEVRVNCEQNSLLYLVKVRNVGACHTKNQKNEPRMGCYYRKIGDQGRLENLNP